MGGKMSKMGRKSKTAPMPRDPNKKIIQLNATPWTDEGSAGVENRMARNRANADIRNHKRTEMRRRDRRYRKGLM